MDLLWVPPRLSYWNFILKNFYIWSSIYIIVIMLRVFARTREREKAWKFGGACAAGSLALAPVVTLIYHGKAGTTLFEVSIYSAVPLVPADACQILYTFSLILESVCVLPQLLLLRQTTVPTVIDSFYLLTLGSYRAFYILNWIVRGVGPEHHADWIQIISGVIQTALYVDFAWVYWTRQRVKLRGGGVVDSDDMSKGWIVNRVLGAAGRRSQSFDEEAPAADSASRDGRSDHDTRKGASRWGARGISVSADDTLEDHDRQNRPKPKKESTAGTEDELQGMLSDDDDEEGSADNSNKYPSASGGANGRAVLNSGNEWENHK